MEHITSSQTFIDPVCMMKMFPERIQHTFDYENHTYYSCAEACRMALSAGPDKYLHVEPVELKRHLGALYGPIRPPAADRKATIDADTDQ